MVIKPVVVKQALWDVWLKTACDEAAFCQAAVSKLAESSAWLLRKEALLKGRSVEGPAADFLEKAGKKPESLIRPKPGATWILFARNDRGEDTAPAQGLLRDAFLLPVCWKPKTVGEEDSPALPASLRGVANQVRELLQAELKKELPWVLGFQEEVWGNTSLGEIGLSCPSGFGALATSLLMAEEGLTPKAGVFISALWDAANKRLGSVAQIPAKWSAAREFGATTLFVADEKDKAELLAMPETSEEMIRIVNWREAKLPKALLPALQEMQIKPTFPADGVDETQWKKCCEYAGLINDRDQKEQYILENVTPYLARIQKAVPPTRPKKMLLIVSQISSALLSLSVFRPESALILHSSRDRVNIDKLKKLLRAAFSEKPLFWEGVGWPEFQEVGVSDFQDIQKKLFVFFSGSQPEDLCIADVLGGTTGMKGAAIMALCQHFPKIGIVFFESSTSEGGYTHKVGTEKLMWLHRPEK